MLGDIRLGNAEFVLQLADATFAFAEQIQQVQADGVGKRLADHRLALKDFVFNSVASACHKLNQFHNCETDTSLPPRCPSAL